MSAGRRASSAQGGHCGHDLHLSDVGVDCDWKTSGETEDEVMADIQEHAAQIHPDIELTPDLVAAVRGAIKGG